MNIVIQNAENAEIEAISKAISKATKQAGNAEFDHITILCRPRVPADAPAYKHPGWLEYLICFFKEKDDKGPSFVLAMIQRQPETEFEFHS